MRKFIALVSLLMASMQPALALDAGTVQGTLQIGGKPIVLQKAYALLHDNAEGVLNFPRELRILLTNKEVPSTGLSGLAFLAVEESARQGTLQGLLLKLDPAKPDNINVTVLMKPAQLGMSLVTYSINTAGAPVIKDFKLSGDRVVGVIERRDESNRDPELPATAYALKFSAPLENESAVTADLKGREAMASPQAKAFVSRASAFTRGDFAAVKQLSTQRGYRELEALQNAQPAQVGAIAKQAGADMQAQAKLIERVVVRGERATIIFRKNGGWANFVRDAGDWKSDD